MPFHRLLFWPFEESINSLFLIPNFLNQKSYLGQILWHLRANKSLQLTLPPTPSSWEQIHNRTSKVWGTQTSTILKNTR